MGKYTVKHGLLLLLALTLSPCVAASEPACIAYAYTVEDNEPHASLITEGGYVFGSKVHVISNCNNTSISVDGFVKSETSSKYILTNIQAGVYSITLANDGYNFTMDNVTFIQAGQLSQAIQRLPSEHNPYSIPYTPDEISNMELIAGIGSLLISWVMVISILWKLINNHQQRNFCVEVV